jgi:ABC-type transport system involved in multi-copper enzyme maturation permease subunit
MAFLPIVERELRVASRRKSTHRIRLWTTLAGLLIACFFTLISGLGGRFSQNLGQILFGILTYYAFGMSLLAGVLLAADCLSEEKRDGTLGLLFLTDLKGHDVVLGKLIAVGLSALYGLVAVLPVTALPLLMGGVTVNEYWRMALAMVNGLFFSLAVGLLVSSWSRDAIKAMGNTLALLVAIAVGLPLLGWLLSFSRLPAAWWYLTSFSPSYPFTFGPETHFVGASAKYWTSLFVSHLFGWLLLLLASWSLPRAWQDKPLRRLPRAGANQAMGTPAPSSAWRAQLLEANPILWLAGNNPALVWRIWAVSLGGGAVIVALSFLDHDFFSGSGMAYGLAWLFGALLKLLFTLQACRFFVDARRSGALELVLSTPLTGREIIRGQWLALKRMFLGPVVVLLAAQLFPLALHIYAIAYNTGGRQFGFDLLQVSLMFYKLAILPVDILAVGFVGMWLALSAKKPNLAPAMTILFVLVLPKLAFCVPDLLIGGCFILWARNKLLNNFRQTAMPQYRPVFVSPAGNA